jgi:4-diphosphocytidyl-2-C-methyl-D-erythritol kinase
MKTLFFLSPAKVNLTLQVLKKRPDGYHEIYTIFQKISLYDEIEVELKEAGFELEFLSEENIPLEENLIFKAYKLTKEHFRIKGGIKVVVKKKIPAGAGLGGGSSNAGSILKALAKLFEIPIKELFPVARRLGADVPFFLMQEGACVGEGIGDKLSPYPVFPAWYVIIYPGFKISTAWAYQSLNLKKEKKPVIYSKDIPPWEHSQGLINHFKPLVFKHYPVMQGIEMSCSYSWVFHKISANTIRLVA